MSLCIDCPTTAVLQRLLRGDLEAADAEQVYTHLIACDGCAAGLAKLAVGIDLDSLRHLSDSFKDKPGEVATLLDRLRRFQSISSMQSVDTTAAEPGAWRSVDRRLPSDCEYSFLSKPSRSGDLGQLGQYQIEKVLGRGGMGIVFKGFDPKLSRAVAIKVMSPDIALSSMLHERFLREGRAMAAIKHDHIVSVYQVGEDVGVPYLVMEYLHGESVDHYLHREGQLALPLCVELARQMALGLAAAHEIGLIHRDVKPENMWLEAKTNRVKLLDFGLARWRDDKAAFTVDGTVMGTPGYMSPEQARGQPVDYRTDLFSLGCVYYRMATGIIPFEQNISSVWKHTPADPIVLRPNLPVAFSKLIMQLLSKDPAKRPNTATEVCSSLDAIRLALQDSDAKSQDLQSKQIPSTLLGRPHFRPIALVSLAAAVVCLGAVSVAFVNWNRLPNTAGTIVLENVPAGAKVEVDGSEVSSNVGTGSTLELQVAPGERSLLIKADGYKSEAQNLTIASGKREFVRTNLQPSENKKRGAKDASSDTLASAAEYVSIFNGKDLSGFHIDGNPNAIWKVKNGELLGFWETNKSGEGGSQLISDRGGFQNYRLRVEVMPPENWACSLKILWNEEAHLRRMTTRRAWYSVGIGTSQSSDSLETAKISRFDLEVKPRRPVKLPPNAWVTIEVEVQDTRIRVYVNDILKNEYTIPNRRPNEGNIGISLAGGASLRIRRLEVAELSPTTSE